MSIKLVQNANNSNENTLKSYQHALFILDENEDINTPYAHLLATKLNRIRKKYQDLKKSPVTIDLPNGGLASFVILSACLSPFQRHTLLRKAIKPILEEHPEKIALNM